MVHLIKIFAICFLIGMQLALAASSAHPESDRPSLICFGDSITAHGTWVDSAEAAGPWKLINAGRAGRRTSDVAKELPATLAAHPEAQGILILLGVNDLPARDSRSDEEKLNACLAHLETALDLAMARFPRESIFLVAPCGVDVAGLNAMNLAKGYGVVPPLLSRLEIGMERLARSRGVRFFSLLDTLQPGHYTDGLHPNAEGDAAIAAAVVKAFAGNAPDPLPAFYLVGDSISIDYHEALERECLGRYRYSRKGGLELARKDLDHPQGANGGNSGRVLEHLHQVLQAPAAMADTIVVNSGLHDIKTDPATGKRQVSLEDYRKNLRAMLKLVLQAGKRMVWISTTPVDELRHNSRSSFHRFENDVARYNAAAAKIMAEQNVLVIDLHAFSSQIKCDLFRDHVHFKSAVSQQQAEYIKAGLDRILRGPHAATNSLREPED